MSVYLFFYIKFFNNSQNLICGLSLSLVFTDNTTIRIDICPKEDKEVEASIWNKWRAGNCTLNYNAEELRSFCWFKGTGYSRPLNIMAIKRALRRIEPIPSIFSAAGIDSI